MDLMRDLVVTRMNEEFVQKSILLGIILDLSPEKTKIDSTVVEREKEEAPLLAVQAQLRETQKKMFVLELINFSDSEGMNLNQLSPRNRMLPPTMVVKSSSGFSWP